MAGNPLMSGIQNNMLAGLQNSPIMKMVNMMKSGGNPQAMIQQGSNPQIQQIMGMMQNQSPQQMGETINKLAEQRGVNMGELLKTLGVPDSVAKQLGLKVD